MHYFKVLLSFLIVRLAATQPHQPVERDDSPDEYSSSPSRGHDSGDVRNLPRPKIGSIPYGTIITHCIRNRDLALTFDDGPYIYTATLLDLLARYHIKATFFIVGSNGHILKNESIRDIDQDPKKSHVIRRMYHEGHHVASHTWKHIDLTTLSSTDRREQMYRNEEALAKILRVIPTYMRPPYFKFNDATGADLADLGYHVISTNLDTRDWANTPPQTIRNARQIFNNYTSTSPSSTNFVVLNHDVFRTTVFNLVEYEIRLLQSRGYRTVTIGECLGDSRQNWYRAVSAAH